MSIEYNLKGTIKYIKDQTFVPNTGDRIYLDILDDCNFHYYTVIERIFEYSPNAEQRGSYLNNIVIHIR